MRLVCLPLSPASLAFQAPDNVGTVVGWGFTSAVDQRLESHKIRFRIAEYRQQKAEMRLITQEECAEEWGDDMGPLTKGQCEFVSNTNNSLKTLSNPVCTSNVGVTTCNDTKPQMRNIIFSCTMTCH